MVISQSGGYKAVRVYVEGGGTYRRDQDRLREGFRKLFDGVLGDLSKPSVIACGGRSNAFREFQIAVRSNTDTLCILLVDSEGPVRSGIGTWAHVHERRGDGWERPTDVNEDQLHFMVQMMEAWIVADVDALAFYYGKGFDAKVLPHDRLESVSKDDLKRSLSKAAQATAKGSYDKSDGLMLIGSLKASRVEDACVHARQFFDHLRRVCGALPPRRGARGPRA